MTNPAQDLPPYDIHYIQAQPFPERMRLICRTWLFQVNATPVVVYLMYVFKIAFLYVGGWWLFCSFTPGMGAPSSIGTWAFSTVAFQKAVLWSMILDVAMYAIVWGLLFRALVSPEITVGMLLPIAILLPILGLSDKTIFLAARAEHYYTALICLCYMTLPGAVWIAGCKMVWVAIWIWAATSKLNSHFSSVICVMLTNSPFVPAWFHKKLYTAYPDDLRPSALAATVAHFGSFVEYVFPVVLVMSNGGPATPYALVAMLCFHCFIAGNFPMGMPVEWNVMMVYGGFFLFGHFGEVPLAALGATPALLAFLVVMLVAIPMYGNFVPSRVSFLMAMRYYAGNWAYSVWLFKKGADRKLDKLEKAIPLLRDQLSRIIDDEDMVETAIAMTPSFRLMHLQGRVLHDAIPKAVDDIDEYEWVDGEMVAGLSLGWNFGDGHLHDLRLLEAVQAQCGFEEGELRVVVVESQPLFGKGHAWKIADAATGVIAEGRSEIREMVGRQPWPTGRDAEAAAYFAGRSSTTEELST
jgi:hypothetical protein